MNNCKNSECNKEIPENLNYCSENCIRKHIELKNQAKELAKANQELKIVNSNFNIENEEILKYIGITTHNVRPDAYNHWLRFIDFCKKNSGKKWKDDIRLKLRSYIGVDFRYIDDYFNCCLSWNIFDLKNDILYFKELPKEEIIGEAK